MKKGLSFFLCLLMIGFLVASPALISAGMERNIYAIRKDKHAGDYRGTLEIWHVVTFKTAQKSGYEYLKDRCRRFERRTPYVFIELKGMTLEEAKRRIAEGERPDMISFPQGQIDETKMLKQDAPKNLLESMNMFSDRAQPYMADSYVIVMNEKLIREMGIPQSYGGELSAERFYDAYKKLEDAGKIPIAGTETAGLSAENTLKQIILKHDESYAEEAAPPAHLSVRVGKELFLSGEAGMYICPYSEYIRMQQEGMGFSAEAYAFSEYTDIVQKFGIYEDENESKNEMMRRFAEGIFSERFQKGLEDLGMLPCTMAEGIYESDAQRLDSYRIICEKAVKSE